MEDFTESTEAKMPRQAIFTNDLSSEQKQRFDKCDHSAGDGGRGCGHFRSGEYGPSDYYTNQSPQGCRDSEVTWPCSQWKEGKRPEIFIPTHNFLRNLEAFSPGSSSVLTQYPALISLIIGLTLYHHCFCAVFSTMVGSWGSRASTIFTNLRDWLSTFGKMQWLEG